MVKSKQALISHIERIEQELFELKQAVQEFERQPSTPKQEARSSSKRVIRRTKEYLQARSWAQKTLNLR